MRMLKLAGAFAALFLIPMVGDARASTVASLVHHARGNAHRCNVGSAEWMVNENKCVVRVLFRRWPATAQRVARIVKCESNWDEKEVTPPFGATGLAQFIRSTWRSLPRRYSRRSAKNPVYNIAAMRYVWRQDGDFRQWVCQ